MLHAPEPPPPSAILTGLLNDLASVPDESTPMLLILDDYHVIEDQAIHEALTFFVEHLPDQLHVVLASRVDPDLPLSRWRVRGELLEIRAADLRFSAAEASSFFSQALGDGLTEDDMLLLEARTEGWIARMQLAALAMRQREDRSAFVQTFTGSQRYLLDYVQEEVLERQSLRVQRFLLQTAVLTRLNAALCAALTEERASQAMLEWLERHNLFVVPLDEERQWYRMHELFREVLLARVQASEPELVPLLHQRAAQWYAAQGDLREAIAHALAAPDFASAAELIERAAEQLWLSGEAQTVQSWIGALPDVVVRQHARLALNTALRLLESLHSTVSAWYARGQAQVEQTIARLEAVLQSLLRAPRNQSDSLPPASIAFVRKLLALFDQEVQSAERRAHNHHTHALRSALERSDVLLEPLTRREQEVLRLLVAGASNQEIAPELVISLATAKKHVSNLLGKLGVESRTQAITRAHDWSQLSWSSELGQSALRLHLTLPVAQGILASTSIRHRELGQSLSGQGQGITNLLSGKETFADPTQLSLTYRGSPLAHDLDDTTEIRAGDRAPDAPCVRATSGETVRLFDVFHGTHFTLLAFGARPAPRLPDRYTKDVRAYTITRLGTTAR